MLYATDLIKKLQLAVDIYGDRPVLVKGEHDQFVKAADVYTSQVEDLNQYYLELIHDSEVDDYFFSRKVFTVE